MNLSKKIESLKEDGLITYGYAVTKAHRLIKLAKTGQIVAEIDLEDGHLIIINKKLWEDLISKSTAS